MDDLFEPEPQPDAKYPPLRPEAGAGQDPNKDVQYARRSGRSSVKPPDIIHTEAFKQWFGDWRDPNADHSVIVGPRGRPEVLYHGTQLDTSTQIEELHGGSGTISRALGTHLAFDNRLTDAFTVGRDARRTSPEYVTPGDSKGERAMARVGEGGRVLPVFVNSRNPLDLASGFEPLGYDATDVWDGRPHDDHLISFVVTYLALEEDHSIIEDLSPVKSRDEIVSRAREQKRKIQAGEDSARDEVPPGGVPALIALNHAASTVGQDDLRERIVETFLEGYDYDSLIYVNTSKQEAREETDPLSVIVFDPEDIYSIYAESIEQGDPSLGFRSNPPMMDPRAQSGFSSRLPQDPSLLPLHSPTGATDLQMARSTSTGDRSTDDTSPGDERLEDRLARENPSLGDGHPGAAPGGPQAGGDGLRDNPDREDFVGLMQKAARFRELFIAKQDKIIDRLGMEAAKEVAQQFEGLIPLLREAADESGASYETVKEEVGLVEAAPEVGGEATAGGGDAPLGLPEEALDDRYMMTPTGEEFGRIAVYPTGGPQDSGGEGIQSYISMNVDTDSISAVLDKQAIEMMRAEGAPYPINAWERKGGRWEVELGSPYDLSLRIEFGAGFGVSTGADKAYLVMQTGGGGQALARFLYDFAREEAGSVKEINTDGVQWRVADIGQALISDGLREGFSPEEYVLPSPGAAYTFARPNEPESNPTIVLGPDSMAGFGEDPPLVSAEELSRSEERARQTGVVTAFFVAHGLSQFGQPEEVTRLIVGEKDLKTKDAARLAPSTYSWTHTQNPQTISNVEGAGRDEEMGRGSRSKVLDALKELTGEAKRRVYPVQVQKGDLLDTFYRWREATKPEDAVDAESASDLGFPEGAAMDQGTSEEMTRDFRPSDIGGSEYENVGQDIDLSGRDAIEMTPAERREANRRAVEIITEKEPSQITDPDRDVLAKYTGAGGLGADTGTGSVRGERTEHYTDYRLIDAMWSAMGNVGADGNILEPGAGIGNFAGRRPDSDTGTMVMVEESTTTADILKVLYPEQQALQRNFAEIDLQAYQLQGAIGNVPFADSRIHSKNDPVVQGLPEEPKIHDYFILRSLYEVEPGGVVMLITSTQTADRQSAAIRRAMINGVPEPGHPMSEHRAAFLGGFRLPSGAFEASASTAVTTDLLAFQKLPAGYEMDRLPGEIFEITNQFGSTANTVTDVVKTDRSQAGEEAREMAEKIQRTRELHAEYQEEQEQLRQEKEEQSDRKLRADYGTEEYEEARSRLREISDELSTVRREGRQTKRKLDRLEEQFEEMEGQAVSSPLNAYFDNNPDQIIGELRFGYRRPTLDLFGVEGDLEDAVDAIGSFDPDLPVDTATPKNLFREASGKALGFDRKHPDGAVVFRDGTFYESQPVGYERMAVEEEMEEKARSAVDILETYQAFTLALSRQTEQIEAVRRSLKGKLQNHARRFGVPGNDPDLMEEVFRYDPRRPTLAALVERNEVGNVEFADILEFDSWYNSDQRASIDDDENLGAIAQFLRAQGESLTAESYARFYKGGELEVSEMEELLSESEDFYFMPQVGPISVTELDEETIERVAEEIEIQDPTQDNVPPREEQAINAIVEAYMSGEGSYMNSLYFESGEVYDRMDLFEEIREQTTDEELGEHLEGIIDTLDEAKPDPKEFWSIELDPRHYRSWLPIRHVASFIEDKLGYEVEIEYIDEPEDPDNRRLVLRYRNGGKYVSGNSANSGKSEEDFSMGWHGISYSNILQKYLKDNPFPVKHGGQAYVDPNTGEPIPDVTTKEEAKNRGIYQDNKEIQTRNETKMRKEIPQDFQTWADDSDDETREEIAEAYNRTYRSRKLPDFDADTLNLPGFNFPHPIYEHNKRAAKKMVFNRGGGDNHAVGSGKTFASIIATETLRARGLVNKPLFVVPSQVIEKWMKEYQELFPDNRILVLRGKSEGLKEELFRAQVYDYDTIFITQSGFKALELSPEVARKQLNDRIDRNSEIASEIQERYDGDLPKGEWENVLGGNMFDGSGVLDAVNEWREEVQKIQQEADEDSVEQIYLDEIGVDAFVFDEAHAYKNALSPSSLASEIGIAKNNPSNRAQDTRTKVDWLFWKHGDDVNSFILTATPLENNPLEVWHMLQLCGPSVLERYGIESLDAFIDLYVQVRSRMERSVDGQFSAENVVTGFKNVQELQRVLDERLDIKSYEELINFYTDPEEEGGLGRDVDEIPFGRPDHEVHREILEPSELHELLLEDIRARAEIIRAALSKGEKLTDNFLSLTTDGGLMAEDLRLYQPGFWGYDSTGLKVQNLAAEVEEEYSKTGLPLDENGDPIYPPQVDTPSETVAASTTPPQVRMNPKVVTDRWGAPLGMVEEGDEERENPAPGENAMGHTAHFAARQNPSESREAFIESLEEGELVPVNREFEPGATEEVEVNSFAPRNQIIFTSSSSFKNGPHYAEDPVSDLPYAESVEEYGTPDMSKPVQVKFEDASWLRHIKQKLVDQGIPAEDIAIVSGKIIGLEEGPNGEMQDRFVSGDADKNKLKAEVQEQFQRGEINVLIGTNAISEGMNLDRYTTKMYHLDVPWKPSQIEQRNGRGLRQGNIYDEIDIKFFLLDKSFDNYRLNLVNQKQSWIDDVLYSDFEDGEDDTVYTDDQSGNSRSIDYEEMMVATSESDEVERFFNAVHTVSSGEPELDRLRGELSTRERKKKSAIDAIESYEHKLDVSKEEFQSILNTEIPDAADLEEGVDYEVDFRYNGGKEFRGGITMRVTGEKTFRFTGGGGMSRMAGKGKTNPGSKLMTIRAQDRQPDVKVLYGWSERSRTSGGSDFRRHQDTYLKRTLNGTLVNEADWMDYWGLDAREHVQEKIHEAIQSTLGEEETISDVEVPEVPKPMSVKGVRSLFRDHSALDNLTYAETKQLIGLTPGDRFGSEEAWKRWVPVIEEEMPKQWLSYERGLKRKAQRSIDNIKTKIEANRDQRDLLAKSIEEVEADIKKTEAELEEARQTVEELRGAVNDAMESRFDSRGELYGYMNTIRQEFGINTQIPKRIVGVDTGSETRQDDPPEEEQPMVDPEMEDVLDEGENIVDVVADDSGDGSGGGSGEGSGDTSSSGEDLPPTGEREPGMTATRQDLEAYLQSTPSGASIVDTPGHFIAWVEKTPGDVSVPVDPAILFDDDIEVPGFDSPALSGGIRETTMKTKGGRLYSHPESALAEHLPAPVPHIPTEDNSMVAMVGQILNGAYVDEHVVVKEGAGEHAGELWMESYAAREVQADNATSTEEVRQRLRAEYEGYNPSSSPAEIMPSGAPLLVGIEGLHVPMFADFQTPIGHSRRENPNRSLAEAFLSIKAKSDTPRMKNMHFIYADHHEFVMEALTTGARASTVDREDIRMAMLPPNDQQTDPPAVYYSTPAGVQALIKLAWSGNPDYRPDQQGVVDDPSVSTLEAGDFPSDRISRVNPSSSGGSRDIFPASPIGTGRTRGRENPSEEPTEVAQVDTDHALSYLARTEPGSFKVKTKGKEVRANEEEVHHVFTDPEGSLLLIVPDSRVETAQVPEGTAEEAEEMHEEFTHYDASGESMVMDLPDSNPDDAPLVGYASEIIYESDKVMRPGDEKGEVHTYVHEFDEGQRPVYQWGEEIAIVDQVDVDGRGILN